MTGSFFFSKTVPVLETERLQLRGHRLEDFVQCAAMWADPLVIRYIGGKPLTEEESWTRFLRYVGHWSLGYATEAVGAVVEWGDARFQGAGTACIIAPDNLASIRVAQKCGYRQSQLATYKGHPTLMFVREPKSSL